MQKFWARLVLCAQYVLMVVSSSFWDGAGHLPGPCLAAWKELFGRLVFYRREAAFGYRRVVRGVSIVSGPFDETPAALADGMKDKVDCGNR